MPKSTKQLTPIHPGEILFEDFMKPLGISMNRLARDLRRTGDTRSQHRSRQARHYGGHGAAARVIL